MFYNKGRFTIAGYTPSSVTIRNIDIGEDYTVRFRTFIKKDSLFNAYYEIICLCYNDSQAYNFHRNGTLMKAYYYCLGYINAMINLNEDCEYMYIALQFFKGKLQRMIYRDLG